MLRSSVLVLALALSAFIGGVAEAAPQLVRVVVVMRHGVRPPTQENKDLRQYADQDWPDWPVKAGELTPHGGETVRLMGETIRAAYVKHGLLASGTECSGPEQVSVWADGADQRTRRTGEILGGSLEPGCSVLVDWGPAQPRDPIFGGASGDACTVDQAHAFAFAPPSAEEQARLDAATKEMQAIFAPHACDPGGPGPSGGAGTCFATASDAKNAFFPASAGLAEDILLEYADGKDMKDVGWGRASRADIDTVMPLHEAAFARIRANVYASARRGAAMTWVILGALAGESVAGGPRSGPDLKFLGLAGHDTNLVLMASTFGLDWTLPEQPDSTAPSTALAFELWRDGGKLYVRPVLYYETLDQLRTLDPALARSKPLAFKDCAAGPLGSCPLETLRHRAEQLIPPGCGLPPGEPPSPAPAAAKP
jgi:4-phytase/acid phosphatase